MWYWAHWIVLNSSYCVYIYTYSVVFCQSMAIGTLLSVVLCFVLSLLQHLLSFIAPVPTLQRHVIFFILMNIPQNICFDNWYVFFILLSIRCKNQMFWNDIILLLFTIYRPNFNGVGVWRSNLIKCCKELEASTKEQRCEGTGFCKVGLFPALL